MTDPLQSTDARKSLTLVLCFAMGVLEGFDIQIVGVSAPQMARALGLDATALTAIFFASNFGLLVGAAIGGRFADRHGRRPVTIASAVTFGVFTLATAAADGLACLVAARWLAGLGLGAALPNMVAVAADVSRPERRGRTTAMMFCGIPLGGAAVALAAQGFAGGTGWRTLFVIGGILPLLLAAVQWRFLVETRSSPSISAGVAPTARILFGDGRAARTLLLWTAVAPTLMAIYLILYWLPTLLARKGLTGALPSQAAAAFNLAGVVGAVMIGLLVDRFGSRVTLAGGYAAFVSVAIGLSQVADPATALLLSAGAGFLALGLNYAVYGLAGSCYPAAGRATGTGAALSVGRLGSVIGPTLPGLLIFFGVGPAGVLWLLAPIAALAGVAIVALDVIGRTDP